MDKQDKIVEIQDILKKLEVIVNDVEQDVEKLERNNLKKELLLEELLKVVNA